MAKILTGSYDSLDKARNALGDLISTGFDREKVFLDRDNARIKVMIGDPIEREVREILNRHEPDEVLERAAKA